MATTFYSESVEAHIIPTGRMAKVYRALVILAAVLAGFFLLTPAYDAHAQSDPATIDSDSDGSTDGEEAVDQTDSSDPDSYIEHVHGSYCANWNGYLSGLMQVYELRNVGCSNLGLQLTQYNNLGTPQSAASLNLQPSQQFDLIANLFSGFAPNTYGTVCADIVSGDEDTLDTQFSFYDLTTASFRSGTTVPHSPARTGNQYLGYNHFFPTLNITEVNNLVVGYAEITNEESTVQGGTLIYYSQPGTEVKRESVSLPAHGRHDIDTRSLPAEKIGLLEWQPTAADKLFRIQQSRYYRSGSSPIDSLKGSIIIPAKRGSGQLVATPFDTRSREAVLEISNTRSSSVQVDIAVYQSSGALTSTQPGVLTIAPKSTHHFILNQYLPSALGTVQLSVDTPSSVIASLLEYGLDSAGRFLFATAGNLQAGFGATQHGSYNNYLGACRLRLANIVGSTQTAALSLRRGDGTALTLSSPVTVPANGVVEVNLCGADPQLGYGELTVTPSGVERVTGDIIRSNSDATAEIRSSLSERAICSADLNVTPTSLSIEATSGTPGTLTVTNNSHTVTATNIRATLPVSWTDVTQDASACAILGPVQSCHLSFTPGSTVRSAQQVGIQGDNTQRVSATLTVTIPTVSVITLSGSPLTLVANGPTGTLTINNTSTLATATNITSNIVGTALDGNVVETGNTCASLAPGQSCTLTYTPGSSPVSQTSFTIAGTNTNTVLGSIQIDPDFVLGSISPTSGPASGGTGVTLSGTNLTGALSVMFGGVAATAVNVVNSTTVTAVTPAYAAGAVDVTITTASGSSTLVNGFTYVSTTVGQSAHGGVVACLNGGINNLIAATADNSSGIAWGGLGTTTGATSTSDGAANTVLTTDCLSNSSAGGCPGNISANTYAAGLCDTYQVDSQGNTPCQAGNTCYNDWFLPAGNSILASAQLDCLLTNRTSIGGFASAIYWSSTEVDSTHGYNQNFISTSQGPGLKTNTARVRCVRGFTP